MKTSHFYITLTICGLVGTIGGYVEDQPGTMFLGLLFLVFVLVCNRLTLKRK